MLVPLAITPGLLFYFDVTPKVAILTLGAAITAIWFAAFGGNLTYLTSSRAGRWFCALAVGSAVSLALSTALSVNPALSLTGTNWRRFGMLTQLAILLIAALAAAHFAARPGGIRTVLRASALAGTAAAAYVVLQYFGVDPFLPAQVYHVGEGVWTIVRPPSTLGHASYFADWAVFVVFWCAALAKIETARTWRIFAVTAAGLLSAAIVLSGTRAGIAGLICGALVLTAANRKAIPRRAAVMAAALLACGLLFYFSSFGLQLRSRTRWYVEDARGGARLMLWRDTIRMAGARWATGYGPETFTAAFPAFQSESLAKSFPDFYYESPHNIFLDALVAQGLPGLLALAGLMSVGFAVAWQARGPVAAALAAALAGGAASQQFTGFTTAPALSFYLTVALLIALAPRTSQGYAHPRRALLLIAVPASLLLAIFGTRLWLADHCLERARRAVDAGSIREAAGWFGQFRKWQPSGAGSDLWYSRSMEAAALKMTDPFMRVQALREAGDAALRATSSGEDRQNAWYNLAQFYARQNDAAQTEASLKSAITASPTWFKPHWVLAQVLRVAGRMDEAEREARRAAELDGGKNAEVLRTLNELRTVRGRTPQP